MAHQPPIKRSAKTDAGCRIVFDRFQHCVDLIQPSQRSVDVALGYVDDMVDDADQIPFEKRVPNKVHQILRAIAARWARAPAVTFEASPTGSH